PHKSGEFDFVTTTNASVIFSPVTGWSEPSSNHIQLIPGMNNYVMASYVPIPFAVGASGGQSSAGYAGGPFSPSNLLILLTNFGISCDTLPWGVVQSSDWLSLSLPYQMLAGQNATTITGTINSAASQLAPGSYTDTLTFFNQSNVGTAALSVTLS